MHARRNRNQKARRQIPTNNRRRQRHNIPNPLREIQQQEQIPQETAYQRRHIDPIAPPRIRIRHPVEIRHEAAVQVIGLAPTSYEGGDGGDVGEGAEGRGEEWDPGAGEPPVAVCGLGAAREDIPPAGFLLYTVVGLVHAKHVMGRVGRHHRGRRIVR